MMMFAFLWGITALASLVAGVSLMNGSESIILPSWTPANCLAAFQTDINCDPALVQYLTSPDDLVGWTAPMLQTLCTQSCNSSLSDLYAQVQAGCGDSSFPFGYGGNLTFAQMIQVRQHKFDLVCMMDQSSSQYCLNVETGWNISDLIEAGTVQWPNYTAKIYPDFGSDGPTTYVFGNGTSLPLSWIEPSVDFNTPELQNQAPVQGNMAGPDWYVNRTGYYYSNYGYNLALNWDEYPLQIQCSSCFLQKFIYGITSPWGNVWDEMTSQIWSNMQQNCGISQTLTPANNFTGLSIYSDYTVSPYATMNGTSACVRYLSPTNASTSVMSFAQQNDVAYASLMQMNGIDTTYVGSLSLCAPAACQIAAVNTGSSAYNFVAAQSSYTITQFLIWNPYINAEGLLPGESVCIGPPGGAYTPSSTASQANPTTYSTTATPAAPTNGGTINYCGLYYNVSSGDYCNLISQKFGISLNQLINMNPSINTNCTNLFLGYDYCVAPCCGSTIPTTAPTSTAKAATSTVTTTATASPSYVAPPGPTQSGASLKCYRWYVTQSGDYCYAIEQTYDIMATQFAYWNPEVDANCDIQAGTAYCVDGPPVPSS